MTLLQSLALHCVARAKTLGLRGKARHDMSIDFFCGAYATATERDLPEKDSLGIFLAFSLCPRDFSEVEKIARAAQQSGESP